MALSFTQTEMSKLIGASTRWVRKLTADGVIAKGSDGKYSAESVAQYCEFLRQDNSENSDFRALLDQEKYREKKRENDVADKLLAPIEIIEEVVEKGVAGVIAVAESLPLICKRHFPELTGDQITLIKTGVAEMRNAMAAVEVTLDD